MGQLKNRHVPESLEQLAHGRTGIVFVKVHDVGEPAPEETWLRNNSALLNEKHFQWEPFQTFAQRAWTHSDLFFGPPPAFGPWIGVRSKKA